MKTDPFESGDLGPEGGHLTIKEMPVMERPYEKLETYGPESLTDAELLAVIIRTGTRKERSVDVAARILRSLGGDFGILVLKRLTMPKLMEIKGVGRVKALQVLAVCELARRISKASADWGERYLGPDQIARRYMEDMRHLPWEEARILLMNAKGQILKEELISRGTVNASILSPREIFSQALSYNAVNVILLHNHPSGDPTPSKEDLLITARIRDAGELLGVELADHIIIGDNKYISLREKGLL